MKAIFVGSAALALSGVASAGLLLDSFTEQFDGSGTGGRLEVNGVAVDNSSQVGLGSVLGGARDGMLTNQSTSTSRAGSQAGFLDLSTNSGAEAVLMLTYPIGGVDVTEGGLNDAFAFDVEFTDVGPDRSIMFEVKLDDGTTSHTEQFIVENIFVGFDPNIWLPDFPELAAISQIEPLPLSFPLSDFSDAGIDLSSIDNVMFTFDAMGTATDTAIGPIRFVPAPGAATLLAVAGLVGARRRRNA